MKISGSLEGIYVNFALEKGGLRKISEINAISTHPPPANIKWTFPKVYSDWAPRLKKSDLGFPNPRWFFKQVYSKSNQLICLRSPKNRRFCKSGTWHEKNFTRPFDENQVNTCFTFQQVLYFATLWIDILFVDSTFFLPECTCMRGSASSLQTMLHEMIMTSCFLTGFPWWMSLYLRDNTFSL